MYGIVKDMFVLPVMWWEIYDVPTGGIFLQLVEGSCRERNIYSRQEEEISLVNACTTKVTGDDIFPGSWQTVFIIVIGPVFCTDSRGIGNNGRSIQQRTHSLSLLTMLAAPVSSGILALNLVAWRSAYIWTSDLDLLKRWRLMTVCRSGAKSWMQIDRRKQIANAFSSRFVGFSQILLRIFM